MPDRFRIYSTSPTNGHSLVSSDKLSSVRLKELVAGTNVTLSHDTNGITINATGSGGSGISRTVSVVTVDTSAGSTAGTDYVYIVTVSAKTITLPTAVANSNLYTIKNGSSGNITIAFTGGQTGDGSATLTLIPNQSLTLISDGSNYKIV